MKRVLPAIALAPLVCIACGGATSDTPRVDQASSDLDTTFPGAVIGSPFTAAFAQSWDDGAGAPGDDTKCHGCSTTPDTDPTSQNAITHLPGTFGDYSITTWAPGGGLPTTYASAAGAGDSMLSSGSPFNTVDAELDDAVKDLTDICNVLNVACAITKDLTVANRWSRTFPKVQGKHLVGEYQTGSDGFDSLSVYPSPRAFGEQRSRGAKTYCALRQTVAQQEASATDAYTLDNPPPAGTFAFWSFGKTGANVKVMSPSKFTSDRESEAFLMPVALAGWPNPISGPAMPNFDALSHRMAWVAGDREIFSAEDFGTIVDRVCFPTRSGVVCRPHFREGYRKAYRNLEHVDVLSGEQVAGHVAIDKIPVFRVPPFFNLTMGGDIYVSGGQLDDGALAGGRVRIPAYDGLAPRATTFDDALSAFSVTADAPLLINGVGGPFIVVGGKSLIRTAPTGYAPLTRWKNDDDRAVTVQDQIKEDLHLDASLGIDLGPVHVALDAHSKLNLIQTQEITLREQLSLVNGSDAFPTTRGGMMPQTNIVVIPSSEFTASWDPIVLVLNMTLDFDLDLGFDTVHIHLGWPVPIYSSPSVTLADPVIAATDEPQRLRVGEYADVGATTFDGVNDAPSVYSHLPNRTAPYASFPPPGSAFAGDTVKACLADPVSPPDPPPPGPHVPPPPPGTGALCAIGPSLPVVNSPAPVDLCISSDAVEAYATGVSNGWFGNSTDPTRLALQQDKEKQCIRDVAAYLCSGVSKLLPGPQYSHVQTSFADAQAWGNLELQCGAAFAMGATSAADATSYADVVAKTLMPQRLCTPDGTPL